MKIYSVYDPEFAHYGRVINGIDMSGFVKALSDKTPLPEGVGYVPEEPALQSLPEAPAVADKLYGGLPVQFGWCNGHNTKLNCFEYHRNSEFNLGTEDFILLLAGMWDIVDGKVDSAKTMAFKAPKGVLVEVYASSLHYAPCHTDSSKGFKVLVALPENTNVGDVRIADDAADDKMLWMRNKWLIAHKDTTEAEAGAYVGITGENIDIKNLI